MTQRSCALGGKIHGFQSGLRVSLILSCRAVCENHCRKIVHVSFPLIYVISCDGLMIRHFLAD